MNGKGPSRKVLVVDDEADILDVLKMRLESWGYEVSATSSGTDALEHVQSWGPDLIICDILMPGKDGFQVRRELRDAGRQEPILFVTGRPLDSRRLQEIFQAGDDCIVKPFDVPELKKKVEILIQRAS